MERKVFLINFMFIFMIFLSPFAFLFAQSGYVEEEVDGYDWVFYSDSYKLGYINGYNEAVRVSSQKTMLELNRGGLLPESVTYEAMRNFSEKMTGVVGARGVSANRVVYELDSVYENPSFRSIPVHALIPLIRRHVRGELSSREMRQELLAFRIEYREAKRFHEQSSEAFRSQSRSPKDDEEEREGFSGWINSLRERRDFRGEDERLRMSPEDYRREKSIFPYTRYVIPSTGFKIYLPEKWRVKRLNATDHFLKAQNLPESFFDNLRDYVFISHLKREGRSVRALFLEYVSQMSSSHRQFRIISGKNASVDDKSAYIAVFSYSSGKNHFREMRMKSCWVYDAQHLYVVNYIGDEKAFSKNEEIFDMAIRSITF
ncbi:MAG: hypothetical protein ACE5LC_07965 [Candidatus Aminicenantales bacterium]